MHTLRSVALLALFLLSLTACREQPQQPWIPVLEQADFIYLHDAVAEVRRAVDQAADRLRAGAGERAAVDLAAASHALLKLEDYFLPMTEVRQLIYDADRIYFLGRKEDAEEKLRQARERLNQVGKAGGEAVTKAVSEVIAMIDELERSMEAEPQAVPEKMRQLGERINLMVIKGDLILAGVTFQQER
jgi:DNA-directed RNA polymerase subunit F